MSQTMHGGVRMSRGVLRGRLGKIFSVGRVLSVWQTQGPDNAAGSQTLKIGKDPS